MKRILLTTLAILICLAAFSGCNKLSNLHGNASNEDATPDVANSTFHFDSYEDMIKAFGKSGIDVSSYTIKELKIVMGEAYGRFVDRVNADNSFPQPLIDNKPITYRNKEGFSNITFFVNELYGLPWIWYFPSVSSGENFYISVTYLPDSIIEKQKNMTASEVIKELSPNSANIDNLGKQHESIYNRQITLSDREVTALVIEYKEDTRDNIFFVYDDLLVLVRCNTEVWSDQWLLTLSFDTISK